MADKIVTIEQRMWEELEYTEKRDLLKHLGYDPDQAVLAFWEEIPLKDQSKIGNALRALSDCE